MSAADAGNPTYVAAVLVLYLDLPDTPLRPSPIDQSLANRLHQQAVPLTLVESALLLATLRRLSRPAELADGSAFPEKGRIIIVDRAVDLKTGTLSLIAEFPNPTGLLRPGQFGRVRLAATVAGGRFQREARAISALNHPNICTLFDVGPNYLVMELLDGATLASRLEKGRLPMNSVLTYGEQIADALAAAHAKGIIHRTKDR